jgi:proline dehydrogenase
MRKSLSRVLSRTAQHVARAYIAGLEVTDAIRLCKQVDQHGWHSTICPWDGPNESPERVLSSYREALGAITRESLDCYLSIKVSSLQYDFGRLKELLTLASAHNIRLHFDALGPETASSSLALLARALTVHHNIGYTLPARWRRSLSDANRLIDLGVAIRVVKGQWPDPDAPHLNPAACFVDVIDVLAGRAADVAVATHDVALAKTALKRLQESGTPCELEQLFGLPLCVDRVAKPLNVTVRLYVPYGYAYLPYALSEAKKHPVIFARFFKDLLIGSRGPALRKPRTAPVSI